MYVYIYIYICVCVCVCVCVYICHNPFLGPCTKKGENTKKSKNISKKIEQWKKNVRMLRKWSKIGWEGLKLQKLKFDSFC
jgi:hypothetical protein